MAKLLRTQDKLLLTLSILGDIYDEVKTMGGLMGQVYETAYGYTPKKYRKNNYYTLVSRTLKADYIEKIINGNDVRLRITSAGKEKLAREFPLASLQSKKWDGKWRILTFDIAEKRRKSRDILRRKLKELGFGMLQESLWITPHPIEDDMREFVKSNNLGNEVYLFVSEKVLVGNIGFLVNRLWNIEKLNRLYKEAYETKNKDLYFEALLKDPYLPQQLLPNDWWGNKAKTLF